MKHLTKLLLILFIIVISNDLVRAQDADSDGVVNYLDLDDDNDGIKDLVENCSGFLAQNTSGAWKGKTVSSLTAILTGTSFQPNVHGFSDDQIRYYVNKLGGDRRYSKQGDISFTYIFSTPVPANEIAFFIDDLDAGTVGSSAAEIVFKINGGTPNGNFILADYGATPYLTFDSMLGKITPTGNVDDQRLIIKGVGNLLVSSITFTSTGIGTSDTIAYSLFANNPCDTDGDGIEDYLDLDSDGDGCPDAIEGGGTFTTANLETSTMSGGNSGVGYAGTSTSPVTQNLGNTVGNTATTMGVPSIAGIGQSVGQSKDVFKNDCSDTDGDGVVDWQDLDDDNDGILDAEESPNCFYTVFEANQITSVTSNLVGDGTDSPSGIDIPLLYNDNVNDGGISTAYNFASSQTITSGSTIFTVKYPTPIAIKSLSVAQAANGMASSGYAKLYGSNDDVNYTLLTVGNGISIASSTVNFNNTSTTEYQYYQIRYIGTSTSGNATSVTAGTTAIHEIYSLAASTTPPYNPSAHPKSMICNIDTDGDTIPNNLDTDSDGDGCSDSYEGGATTNKTISVISGPYGANGLANSLETGVESGVVNYISTYRKYATKLYQNLCLDTDNDGVPNPIDLDDDNDGVLDTTEGDFCGKLDRNIRVGYLNTGAGNNGLATNLLYNLNNFGINGVYNKVRGVTLIPFANSASVTEANLLAQNIDVFFVGSSGNDATTSTDKIPTSVNNILTNWAKNNGKAIFALQNNAIDYGYTITNNNINPNTPIGTLGRDYYTNGYWPTASLNQSGSVQMTIKSLSRAYDFLMLDDNLRPVVISDREYNLVIFPDATIYNNEASTATPTSNDQKAIADTWSYVFDKFLETQCTSLDTDGDGIPNHLDLDSDQDGCSDAVEAGATKGLAINVTSNFAFVTNAGTSTDSNSDGLADIVDTNLNGIPDYLDTYNPQAIDNTIKKCTDSDQDGYLDINDLDDDNDGILDTDEGQTCNSLNRNLRVGYVNTTLGKNGLMINMLSNLANFGPAGTYNKFPGITFVPYASQAAVTEAQLLTDNIDVFYAGSSATDAQTSSDKLLTATNNVIMNWASTNDKGVIVLQNNATDYGYIIKNVYPNSNPNSPYGPLGEAVFTNGYWPESTFNMSGTVQMSINSETRRYDTAMADVQGKATFIRDRDEKIVFIPDATIFIDNQSVSTIGTNATLKVAADVWAFAFDVFISGNCTEKDTDGDGIPNHLDLDSDNDGCPDAIEGGGNFNNSSLVNSTMPGGNSGATSGTYNLPVIQNLGNTVGNTTTTLGIPTIAGTGQSFGYSDNADVKMCLDSDADGVPDVCDLDDDNDGILDVNENNCSGSLATQNVRIGYIPNSRDLDGDIGYTFDGAYMSGSGALKLTDAANFGSTGTVKANITLVPIIANPITKADITNLNLNAIFLGGIDNTTSSYLSDAELAAIKDWSDDKASNFVVVTQFQSKAWSSTITSGNVNPDKPTDFGKGTSIFNGPFGIISTFNQGGGYQAYFGTLNGACSTKNIAVDNNGRTVMYVDGIYNDLIIADVDILTTLGGVTSGSAITSNNDKLFGNIWAFVVSQSSCSDIDTDGDGIPNRLDLDSDNDGCLDALEGSQNITTSQLVNAVGTVTVGTGSTASNQNLCATTTCVDTNGVPTAVGSSGQGIGDSQNAAVQSGCFCYKPAVTSGTALDTKHGITALARAGANNSNWPMVRKGAWTALESKEKGFVINRIPTTAEVEAISNPVEGMMVYDEEADCLKIYTTTDGTTFSWQCFNTQACPE